MFSFLSMGLYIGASSSYVTFVASTIQMVQHANFFHLVSYMQIVKFLVFEKFLKHVDASLQIALSILVFCTLIPMLGADITRARSKNISESEKFFILTRLPFCFIFFVRLYVNSVTDGPSIHQSVC